MSENKTPPKPVHVSYLKDRDVWEVKKEGNKRASRIAKTKEEAIDLAQKAAIKSHAELVIHNEDGSVDGHDPEGLPRQTPT